MKGLIKALEEIRDYVDSLPAFGRDTSSANHCGSIADDALLQHHKNMIDSKVPVGMEYPEGINPECCRRTQPLTYLACPYTHPSPGFRHQRFEEATKATAWLIENQKWNVFSPITHSHPLASLGLLPNTWDYWRKIDREYLECCCRLVVLQIPGWDSSKGVAGEIEIAKQMGMEILFLLPAEGIGYRFVDPEFAGCPAGGWPKDADKTPGPEPKKCGSCCTETNQPTPVPDGMDNPKDLIGMTKPPLRLVPPVMWLYVAKVMQHGASKYGPYNWRQKAVRYSVYLEAAMRHILAAMDGEEMDPESKYPHTAHAAACMGIILDAQSIGKIRDDRASAGAAARVIKEMTHPGNSIREA